VNRTYVGVDCGLTGGIAAIIPGSPIPALFEMPVVPLKTDKTKNVLSGERLRGIVRKLREECGAMLVMVESPQMRPAILPAPPLFHGRPHSCPICRREHFIAGQGMASTGNFVRQGGLIEGLLLGLDVPFEFCQPKAWKASIFKHPPAKEDAKELSRLEAIKLYPVLSERLKLKKTHGLAEALLIAHYASKRYDDSEPF
jgi:hypothetical protein